MPDQLLLVRLLEPRLGRTDLGAEAGMRGAAVEIVRRRVRKVTVVCMRWTILVDVAVAVEQMISKRHRRVLLLVELSHGDGSKKGVREVWGKRDLMQGKE